MYVTEPNLRPDDGRIFLQASALILILSGFFAFFLGVSGHFLPHDEQFLGMNARQLCARHGCRIVHFMIHDRVSFGGALVAIGLLYLWLIESPLRQGQAWAWWTLCLSGVVGFGSFFAYLGYGYLDTWHGIATLGLLVCFLLGLMRSHPHDKSNGIICLLRSGTVGPSTHAAKLGRASLLLTAAGLAFGGLVILMVGMTCVFVPQDLAYMGLSMEDLHALNPRLVPLIAHDRAGFGGAVCCCGMILFFCIWCGTLSRSLWIILGLVGVSGFGSAIGIHPSIGYNDLVHLAPALLGAFIYLLGMILTLPAQAVPVADTASWNY